MKKTNRFLVGLLAMATALTAVGCGGTGGGGTGTSGGNSAGGGNSASGGSGKKTELRIASMAAGLGSQWLIDAEEAFEAKHANTSFKDGKQGVDVILTQPTQGISSIFNGISSSGQHIVFTEQGFQLTSYIDSGKFLPITDVVTDTTREGGSIESKMFDKFKEVFKKGDEYYALPHAEFYGGLAYNHDVFLEHDALLADASSTSKIVYEGKYNPTETAYFVNSKEIGKAGVVLSAGPDGKKGTEDDGLPCSVQEFMILLDYFNSKGVSPIVLSGQWRNMVNYFICGMWASLAGQEQMESYYSLNGEIEVVTGFSKENLVEGIDYVKKPITEKVTITPENAYLGNSMAAKYYAYALAEMIQHEKYYLEVNSETDHLAAQKILINSGNKDVRDWFQTERTAMLMDGSYWINESTDANNFFDYEDLTGELPDIRHMALPTSITNAEATAKITAGTNAPSTLMDINYGSCVVNANIKDNQELIDCAKEFLKFFYSEDQLKAYTKSSRQFIALSYDFSSDELKELDPFYQRLWKLRDNKKGSNIVYPAPRAGTDAASMTTYKRAITSIYTYLQSANLACSKPYTNNAYTLYANTGNKLEGELYKYGSQYIFKDSEISQQAWHAIYNVAV